MRQFFILLGVFICSSVLADHNGSQGHNYNGRTFSCYNFKAATDYAETEKTGRTYLASAFCKLHRGHLVPGIATLKQAAAAGEPMAAMQLAEYYSSEGYNLRKGQVTENIPDLEETIRYQKRALELIRQSNYPFDDPIGDDLRTEIEDQPYLKTASNLTGSYMSLFSAKSIAHIEGEIQNIGDVTLKLLTKTINAANNCLAIPYNQSIWNRSVYDNTMAVCREDKKIAETLLPLERQRLRVAYTSCQNIRLSQCAAHNAIDSQIEQLYNEYLGITARLLASL